jgi:hypothetical protein
MAHFLVERVNELKWEDPAPQPWTRNDWAVGGLTNVGFAPNSDLLLVLSSAGRGVFDTLANQKLARDRQESGDFEDSIHLTCYGIGPLEGQPVRMAGIWGGGLPMEGQGWWLTLASPNWPLSSVILEPPGYSLYDNDTWMKCYKVGPHAEDDDIKAAGFSETGNTFIIAMSHTLQIFTKPSDETITAQLIAANRDKWMKKFDDISQILGLDKA